MLPQIWMLYKLVRSPIYFIVLKLTVTLFIPLKLKAAAFIKLLVFPMQCSFQNHMS